MPTSIRSWDKRARKFDLVSKLLSSRVIAVRHLRAHQAKSIAKAIVKTTIISKQRPNEYPNYQSNSIAARRVFSRMSGDVSLSDSHHQWALWLWGKQRIVEIFTDNQDFCGQASIPIASLRTGQSRFRLTCRSDRLIR
jgi:hypothetical protein